MIDLLRGHRPDNAHVVCDLSNLWKSRAEELSRLTPFFKFQLGCEAFQLFALQLGDRLALSNGFRHGFTIHFLELGLVVKSLQVGRTSSHTEKMTRFAFGFPLSFACGGRLAGQACGLAIALPPSILERAVEPIPTVAWFKKVLRFIKVGFMIRAKLEAGGGFIHIE
jgi:hypothetical protein